jgi:hypothetical protein
MLSRGNSDANSRLRRAKSTSSCRRTHVTALANAPLDPEIAHQHAVAAALRAMELANERGSTETTRKSPLSRNNSTASNNTVRASPKPQVVRFVGPRAVQQKSSSNRRKEAASRTSTTEVLDAKTAGVTAIPQIGGDGLGDGYNSTPSSYRRLRKAKSMFSPRKRATSAFAGSTPTKSEASHFRGVGRPSFDGAESRVSLRLHRSMSFIRGGGEQLTRVFKRSQGNDAAIQMARDQFFNQLEQQRLKERPSFIFAPRLRRQQNAFRKTVRTSSTTSFGPAISSSHNQTFEADKAEQWSAKNRSLSMSIRNKFKRVFGRGSHTQVFPAQQMDATRAHFRDYVPTDSGVHQSYENIPTLDGRSLSRGSYQTPSIRFAPSNEDLRSQAGSIRTMPSRESLSNAPTSRITSWTDSTSGNTINTKIAVERKRLSVIQEHGGPHQPSSSAGRVGDGYSVFRKPLRSQTSTNRLNQQVDTQRVYSALVKRIDENSPPKAQPGNQTNGNSENHRGSARSQRSGAIIKAIPEELMVDSATVEASSRHSSHQIPITRKPVYSRNPIKLTPQQLAQHNEGTLNLPKQQPLREVRSAFFPFTTEIQTQTPSPFKRSMAAHKGSQLESDEENSVIVRRRVESYQPTATVPRRDSSFACSASVYSRSSSGNTPNRDGNGHSPSHSDKSVERGTAVIISNTPRQVNNIPTTATRPPMHASKSSAEWKTWVDSQMSTLDRQNSIQSRLSEARRPPTTHYRESAQIDGDDTQVGRTQYAAAGSLVRPGIPDGQPHTVSRPSRPSPPRRVLSGMNDRFPLIETKSLQRMNNFRSQDRRPSPDPGTSAHNDENPRVSAVPTHRPPSSVRLRSSQATLRSERNYSEPRPPSVASSRAPSEKKIIILSSSDTNFISRKDMLRAQSSNTLQENYGRSTPNVLRHPPSHRSGLSNQYLAENRRLTKENLRTRFPEKSYDGDDESPGSNGQLSTPGSRSSKRMVDLFLSSRRHLQRQQRRVSSEVEESGSEPAFV